MLKDERLRARYDQGLDDEDDGMGCGGFHAGGIDPQDLFAHLFAARGGGGGGGFGGFGGFGGGRHGGFPF